MADHGKQGPKDSRAIRVKRLKNGGVVYELNSTEAAAWLRKEKAAFIEGFGGESMVMS